MQIVVETALFCLALIAPALLASSFRNDSAVRSETHAASALKYVLESKLAFRWLGKRKRAEAI